jgi:diguanylate cyclase (GGDEF)-like protein
MDRRPSGTRTDTRRNARRECEGLWDWNLASNRIHYSPGWVALAGLQDQEVGTAPDEWLGRVHSEDNARLMQEIETARSEGVCDFDFQYRLRHKDGSFRWMRSRGLVVRNERGEAIRFTGAQADVTVEMVTDTATGLPNRLLLLDRLSQSISRARHQATFHYAVVLIDVGRPAGSPALSRASLDPVLNSAARRLETCLRKPETRPEMRQHDLVARVDADRLAILLDGLDDLNHATLVADRVLAEMLEPFTVRGREMRVSPAIGIALSTSGYTQPDEVLQDADTALHRARVLGGSHSELFDPGILRSQQSALQLEAELETAVHREEFEIAYQPIVSLASHEVIGFEALVRWRHAVLGFVPPLDFIPAAERTGLIVPLGEWILRQACAQLRAWQTSLPGAAELWVSVNVSGVQLRHPALVGAIDDALSNAGLEGRHLVLELTEGTAMDDPAAASTVLMRLRAMGIRISIDDFGTGYSSLAYVRQLPVDSLKLDQSFVRVLAHDKHTAAIVSSIMAMAGELGLNVVAEGVETGSQLAALQSLHCQSAQGYLFAKPLDPDSVVELLRDGLALNVEPAPCDAAVPAPGWAAHLRAWFGRRLLSPSHGLAAAAGVAGVLTVGVGTMLLGDRTPAQQSAIAPAGPRAGRDAVSPGETHANAAKNTSAKPDRDAVPAGSPGQAPSAASAAAGPTAATPAARTPDPAAPKRTTYDVVHLHRFGSCRGRLEVSSRGVAFVPEQSDSDDGFTLAFGALSHGIDGRTLIIRSVERIYRFNLREGDSASGNAQQVAQISDAIVRARP